LNNRQSGLFTIFYVSHGPPALFTCLSALFVRSVFAAEPAQSG
jgi:phosphatidate phosphatase APP1